MSGNPSCSDPQKIRVKTDSFGIPTIIPFELRKIVRHFIENKESTYNYVYQLRLLRALLTCLSIYRVFPTKVIPKLDTITDPIRSYSVTSLDYNKLEDAVREIIPSKYLRVNKSKIIGGESAGPNSKKSI
jgi:hypothetical protein